MAIITSENAADTATRYQPLARFLEKKLGRPVEYREASDYAAVVEAMAAKQLELAYFGAASYVKAWQITGGNVEPLLTVVDNFGNIGYHSAMIVRADSPYRKVEDLRGKRFAYVDPNSTSGCQAPQYYLTRQGMPPAEFFGATGFTGSHENSIMAVENGSYDAATIWWNNDEFNALTRMSKKDMIDPARFRVIWDGPQMPYDAWTIRKDLPAELRGQVKAALMAFQAEDPEGWLAMTDGLVSRLVEVSHDDYQDIIVMLDMNLKQRREQ